MNRIQKKIKIIIKIISKKINSPLTSSLGRLFDGIATIIGNKNHVSFEGQAAMNLEMLADNNREAIYDYEWLPGNTYKIFTQPIVCDVVKDMEAGIHPSRISSKFHMTLVKPKLSGFLLDLRRSLAHKGFAKILDISTGMPAVFANPYASKFQHISSQKIAQLRLNFSQNCVRLLERRTGLTV